MPLLARNRSILMALVALLFVALSACSQPDPSQAQQDVSFSVTNIAEQVDRVELTVNGQTYSHLSDTTADITFGVTLPFGEMTFVARGFDAATGGVVLYKTDPVVTETITADTTQINLTMQRITSAVTITATGVGPGETVRASIGGVTQGLVVDGSSAVGTLEGVPTGSDLQVSVAAYSGTTLTKQGTATLDLSENDEAVTVALDALPPANDAPEIRSLSLAPGNEIVEGTELTLTVNLFDPNDNLEEISVNWGDGDTTVETVAADLDGDIAYTHTYSAASSFNITVTATDSAGVFATESTSVTVTPADTSSDVDVIVDTGPNVVNVTIAALNVPNGTSSVTAVVTNPGFNTTDLKGSYQVELIPDLTDAGRWFATIGLPASIDFSLSYTVTDSSGNETVYGSFTFNSDDGSVEQELEDAPPTNQAPVADAGIDQVVIDIDNSSTQEVTLDGSGSSDSDGSIASYAWSATGVTISDGVSPTASFPVGTTVVTLTVTDDDSTTATDTVSITVEAPEIPNRAPVAVDDSATTDEGAPVTIDVLTNDTDGDNDALTVDSVTDGSDGSVTISGSNVIYTPDSGFVGTDTFNYTVSDGTDTDTATVTVTVEATVTTIVPLSKTCSGNTCEISIELVNFDEPFAGFAFDFAFTNGSYAVDESRSRLGGLTSGFPNDNVGIDPDGSGTVGGATSVTEAVDGSGQIYILVVTKTGTGSDTLTTSNGALTKPDYSTVSAIPGGSISLP